MRPGTTGLPLQGLHLPLGHSHLAEPLCELAVHTWKFSPELRHPSLHRVPFNTAAVGWGPSHTVPKDEADGK